MSYGDRYTEMDNNWYIINVLQAVVRYFLTTLIRF
jgi:hypothetical protein